MKLIKIHIGPPKTGTTTIQFLLDKYKNDIFIGAGSQKKDLSEKIRNFFIGGDDLILEEIHFAIVNLLDKNSTLVYSDERVLMEYSEYENWKQHLNRLKEVFSIEGVKTEVIITIRNPADALPSLYQQLKNIKWVSDITLQEFINTRQAQIFNYFALEREIYQSGFDKIKYFDFNNLLEANIDVSCFNINGSITNVQPKNESNKSNNARLYNYTAADLIRRNIGFLSFLFPNKFKIKVAKLLNINMRKEVFEADNVKIPKDMLNAFKTTKSHMIGKKDFDTD